MNDKKSSKTRKNISPNIAAEVIFKSNRECVVCDNHKRGDHIHHIDGNNSNNKIENLAFLCFNCHDEASLKGSLRKKLSAKTIIKFRDHKYQAVAAAREKSLIVFNSPATELTSEDLLTISKNALIIIEIEKLKDEYFSTNWNNRLEVLSKLNIYSSLTNFRLAVDVFNFLSLVADQTRSGMPTDISSSILSSIINFFPIPESEEDNLKTIELADECINIAFILIYDTTFYLKNHSIAINGISILKFIYKLGKQQKLNTLCEMVKQKLNVIEREISRPEREKLQNALELVNIFKANIDKGN